MILGLLIATGAGVAYLAGFYHGRSYELKQMIRWYRKGLL